MAVSTCPKVFTSFECRSDPDFSGHPRHDNPGPGRSFRRVASARLGAAASSRGLSSRILRFPPNFVRQLSIKARRNCSNIGVAQIVAASWANNSGSAIPAVPAATAVDTAATAAIPDESGDEVVVPGNGGLQIEGLPASKEASFLSSDGSLSIHAGIKRTSLCYSVIYLFVLFDSCVFHLICYEVKPMFLT